MDKNGGTYNIGIIPNKVPGLKFEARTTCSTFVDKTRKINAHVLMRAMGLSDNDVLDKLHHPEFYSPMPPARASVRKTSAA